MSVLKSTFLVRVEKAITKRNDGSPLQSGPFYTGTFVLKNDVDDLKAGKNFFGVSFNHPKELKVGDDVELTGTLKSNGYYIGLDAKGNECLKNKFKFSDE